MPRRFLAGPIVALLALPAAALPAAEPPAATGGPPGAAERIVTREQARRAEHPPALRVLRLLSAPQRLLFAGLERGALFADEKLARWYQGGESGKPARLAPLLARLNEGSGPGGGARYALLASDAQRLELLGQWTVFNYQELDLVWTRSSGRLALSGAGSYQWRPQERFFGAGNEARATNRSDFSLRQAWTGASLELRAAPGLRLGGYARLAGLEVSRGGDDDQPAPWDVFPSLIPLDRSLRLGIGGLYADLALGAGPQRPYGAAASARGELSHQLGLGDSDLSYLRYAGRASAQVPVFPGRSALVGQAAVELLRERPGSEPIPFFLLTRAGGYPTLRGLDLDRLADTGRLQLGLEYRWRLHPQFQASAYVDQGLVLARGQELGSLDWHRGAGVGLQVLLKGRTALRFDVAASGGRVEVYLGFHGDQRSLLGGALRPGAYRP